MSKIISFSGSRQPAIRSTTARSRCISAKWSEARLKVSYRGEKPAPCVAGALTAAGSRGFCDQPAGDPASSYGRRQKILMAEADRGDSRISRQD